MNSTAQPTVGSMFRAASQEASRGRRTKEQDDAPSGAVWVPRRRSTRRSTWIRRVRLGRMAILVHRYDSPDRFVAGTVGQPVERTFFLQAREGNRITSVACEKQQVSVLAEHLDKVLERGATAQRPAGRGAARAGAKPATPSRWTRRSPRSSGSAR